MNTATSPAHHPRRAARRLLGGAACAIALVTATVAQAQVGLARFDVGGLPVTLVYPTEVRATRQAFGPYELEVATGAPLAAGAPRRLIVMSHGSGGSPLPDHAMAATLARAGFVVAQPLHAGDNHADTSRAGPASWQLRPTEVSRVIDALAADPRWAPRLQLDRVGVHGMSAGGVTALALAGAQWRVLDLAQHCNAHLEQDLGFCFNGVTDPAKQAERKAAYERARGVPEAYLPAEVTVVHGGRTPPAGATGFDPRPDPRIASVTLAVPLSAIFTAQSLARIAIPVGVVSATADTMLLPAYHSGHVLRECGRCTLLAELQGAAHFDLLSPWPASVADAVALQMPRGGRTAPGFDPRLRTEAMARIVDFHRRNLAQD